MVVVCIGPVCIPLYGLVPILVVLLKPIWNRLPLSVQNALRNAWRTVERSPFLLVLLVSFGVALSVLACYYTMKNQLYFSLATIGTVGSAGMYLYRKFYGRPVVATPESIRQMEKVVDAGQKKTIAIDTEQQWHSIVAVAKKRTLTLVADFSSEACKPCKAIAPVFEELAAEFSRWAVYVTVDIDKVPTVRDLRGVVAVPTFQAIAPVGGSEMFSLVGADEERLRALVSVHVGGNIDHNHKGAAPWDYPSSASATIPPPVPPPGPECKS